MSKPLVIGTDCEPYGAGPRVVTNGFWSDTERDRAIRDLQERLAVAERMLAEMNVWRPLSPEEIAELAKRK